MAKLFNILGALSLAVLLALGGLGGYLWGTGRLDAVRVERIASALRGDEPAQADSTPVTVVPSSAATDVVEEEPRARTINEVRAQRKRQHLEILQTERAARDLEAQRLLLDQALQRVMLEQERLATDRDAFLQRRERIKEAARDVGFQKELELVSGLQPRQAKEHLLRVWASHPADAVRLINAMDTGRARRILEEFKTDEELKIQSALLEQIRLQGMGGSADASGMTADVETP